MTKCHAQVALMAKHINMVGGPAPQKSVAATPMYTTFD